MIRSRSSAKLHDQFVRGGAVDPDATPPPAAAQPTVTVNFPSRFFPAAGLAIALVTLFTCVAMNRYYGHDIGGLPWPYISDTAKDAPQAGIFGFGMTLTSVMIWVVVVVNYGKVKRDIYALRGHGDARGLKRNKAALVCGLIAAPCLGLLATFDTARTPRLHLLFVLVFFLSCVVFLFMTTHIYTLLVRAVSKPADDRAHAVLQAQRYISLRTSLYWKRCVSAALLVSVFCYLPLGMYLVEDWYDYRNDVAVHTFRAVTQHMSVLCLILFFGTFVFDFGDLDLFVVQT